MPLSLSLSLSLYLGSRFVPADDNREKEGRWVENTARGRGRVGKKERDR